MIPQDVRVMMYGIEDLLVKDVKIQFVGDNISRCRTHKSVLHRLIVSMSPLLVPGTRSEKVNPRSKGF